MQVIHSYCIMPPFHHSFSVVLALVVVPVVTVAVRKFGRYLRELSHKTQAAAAVAASIAEVLRFCCS